MVKRTLQSKGFKRPLVTRSTFFYGIVFLPILLTVAMPNEVCVCQNEDGRK
ncbi:unnamed protein product [Meloidogyne enterolobii]|uniref:Uncharacterized protein n=1 Tax=Meloidogyne enterolobii TaxID=390850 RepID=A0ACB1B374_MELEN